MDRREKAMDAMVRRAAESMVAIYNAHAGQTAHDVSEVDMAAARAALAESILALGMMPDYIETFRIMRDAGRKRVDMAKAVAQRIDEVRGFSWDGDTDNGRA